MKDSIQTVERFVSPLITKTEKNELWTKRVFTYRQANIGLYVSAKIAKFCHVNCYSLNKTSKLSMCLMYMSLLSYKDFLVHVL